MNKSQCAGCAYWRSFSLTYDELALKWDTFIGGGITPGHKKRYQRAQAKQRVSFSEVILHYKTCAQGQLNRFYVMKDPKDLKPMIPMKNCSAFAKIGKVESSKPFTIPSPFWITCSMESHGVTRVKGCDFTPGLYENSIYFRVPVHNDVKPQVVKDGTCSVCGEAVERGLEVREVQTFCCNEHYLRWWQERHPELFRSLNKAT